MVLERFTHPSRYLGSIVFAWGVIMTCTGIVQNFAGLTVVRFLLGLFECVDQFSTHVRLCSPDNVNTEQVSFQGLYCSYRNGTSRMKLKLESLSCIRQLHPVAHFQAF